MDEFWKTEGAQRELDKFLKAKIKKNTSETTAIAIPGVSYEWKTKAGF
jgi:hypothetical protein